MYFETYGVSRLVMLRHYGIISLSSYQQLQCSLHLWNENTPFTPL